MNAYSLCRLCLNHHDGTPACGGIGNSEEQSLPQLVMQYLPIQIVKTEDSGFPFVCESCISRIQQWHQFCTSCIDNDRIYQKLLSEQHQAANGQTANQGETMLLKEEIMLDSDCVELTSDQHLEQMEPPNAGVLRVSDNVVQEYISCDSRTQSRKLKARNNRKDKSKQKKRKDPTGKNAEMDQFLTDDGIYQCPYCPSVANARNKFRVHINIHTRAKLYTCDTCGKEFTRSNSLREHMSMHDIVPTFVCPVCSKSFYYRASLVKHKRTHFEGPKIPCSKCDHMSYTNAEMRQHFKRKHLKKKIS